MAKIKSIAELKKLKEEIRESGNVKKKSELGIQIKIALATCSIASGAKNTLNFIIDELEKRNIEAQVTQTGCMGYCYAEPTIEVTLPGKDPVVFGFVDEAKADEIIEKYVKNGELTDGIVPVNYESITD